MKKIFLIILSACAFSVCEGQGNYGYSEGLILRKQGDTLRCLIERAVTYEKDFYYKSDSTDKPKLIATKDVKSIILPYTIVENINIGKKERLLNLITNGKIKLYIFVELFENYHRLVQFENGRLRLWKLKSAETDYYLKTQDTLIFIRRGNFKEILMPIMKDCEVVYAKLIKNTYKFDDIYKVIQEYNRCDGDEGKEKVRTSSDPVLTLVENMPEFPGGDTALSNYFTAHYDFSDVIYDSLYPIYYTLTLNKSGQVEDIEKVRGNTTKNEPLIEKTILKTSGKWIPGIDHDSLVNAYVPFIVTVFKNKIIVSTSGGKFRYERGKIRNGYKKGIWEYYDTPDELSLKVDYTTGKLLYLINDTSDYVIKENGEWIKSKLDMQPRYIGSMTQFYEIIKLTEYPEKARRNITTGIQYISFEIDTTGKAGNFKALNDIGDNCAKAALDAVKLVPNVWMEASRGKRKYVSKFILPVRFIIEKYKNKIVPDNKEKPGLSLAKMLDEVVINFYETNSY